MEPAGHSVEQHFGKAEASNDSCLFQGNVNGPLHIHHETRATQYAVQRVIPFPFNEDVVDRDVFAAVDRLLPSAHPRRLPERGALGPRRVWIALARWAWRAVSMGRLRWAGATDGRARADRGEPVLGVHLDNADNLAAFEVASACRVGRRQPGAEKRHSLCDFVPRGPAGTVLWTSRDKQIGGNLVGARRATHVGGMTEGEARTLLEAVRGEETGETEAQDAAVLLAELERLPLAVSQAAAYMRRTSNPNRRVSVTSKDTPDA
ncbi:hypothetical protein GE09DRAFT_1067201 [Coniochaeta sp. 2T2.1]|nr:hypothetical protein GE09DRAFT_1067201 [Coniochaeta sp. 2T2.1]